MLSGTRLSELAYELVFHRVPVVIQQTNSLNVDARPIAWVTINILPALKSQAERSGSVNSFANGIQYICCVACSF